MFLAGEIYYIDGPGATLSKLADADVLTMEEAKAAWAAALTVYAWALLCCQIPSIESL